MNLFLIYLRLRTVTITITSKLLDVLDVLEVVGGGGVSDLPSVGMFPAKIGVDNATMRVRAIANRFMVVAPLRLRKCRILYINENRKEWNNKARLLARWARANYYFVCIRSTSR